MISQDFDFLIEEFGPPVDPVFVPEQRLVEMEGRLPHLFLEFWRQFGVGSWHHGIFRFCLPEDFQSVVDEVFTGDSEIKAQDCCAYGYSGFSELQIWHRTLGWMKLDLVYKTLTADFTGDAESLAVNGRLGPDRVIAASLFSIVERSDLRDGKGKPLFERARKALGDLQPGECYGFVPAIGLGGTNELEYLRRVRAQEHFAIITGLAPFKLIKFDGAQEIVVRRIGR